MTQLVCRCYPSKSPMSLTWQKLSSLVMMYKDSSGTFFFLCNMACQNTVYLKFHTCDLKNFTRRLPMSYGVLLLLLLLLLLMVVMVVSLLLFTVFCIVIKVKS